MAGPSILSHTDACERAVRRMVEARTMDTSAWRLEHPPHCGKLRDITRAEHNHPGGRWYWLCCQCGAKHLACEAQER